MASALRGPFRFNPHFHVPPEQVQDEDRLGGARGAIKGLLDEKAEVVPEFVNQVLVFTARLTPKPRRPLSRTRSWREARRRRAERSLWCRARADPAGTPRRLAPSIRDAVDERQITNGTVHHYFDAKQALLLAVVEHIAGTPLDKDTADRMYRLYLTRGIQATTAIEGNTLSEDEVGRRIAGTLELPPSMAYQGQEIDNVVSACNTILQRVASDQPNSLSAAMVRALNKQVLESLPLPENVIPGMVRKKSVAVGSYRGAPAEDCEYLLERMCAFITSLPTHEVELDPLSRAVLLAVWAHIYLAWIHPFGDGNGRTARLVEFMLLLEGGVPAPAAHILSNHYNKTRQTYYLELDRASRSGGDIIPFFSYALAGLVEGLRTQLDDIRQFQHQVIWRDYVRDVLSAGGVRESAQVRTRRLELVIALSDQQTVPMAKLPLLTPSIARAYAQKTAKTLTRDLNALKELGLIEVGTPGVRARIEIIRAFLPPKRANNTRANS